MFIVHFAAGPSKFVMIAIGGWQSDYRPHFFSLSPRENPLPSCLSGKKQAIPFGSRWNAALFPGKGNDYIESLRFKDTGEVAYSDTV